MGNLIILSKGVHDHLYMHSTRTSEIDENKTRRILLTVVSNENEVTSCVNSIEHVLLKGVQFRIQCYNDAKTKC